MMKTSWVAIEIKEKDQREEGQHLRVNLSLKPYQKNQQKETQNLDEKGYEELSVLVPEDILDIKSYEALKKQVAATVGLICQRPDISQDYLAPLMSYELKPYNHRFSQEMKYDWLEYLNTLFDERHLAEQLSYNAALNLYWQTLMRFGGEKNALLNYVTVDQQERIELEKAMHHYQIPVIHVNKTVNDMDDYAALSRLMRIVLSWNPFVQFNLDNVSLSEEAFSAPNPVDDLDDLFDFAKNIQEYNDLPYDMCLTPPQAVLGYQRHDNYRPILVSPESAKTEKEEYTVNKNECFEIFDNAQEPETLLLDNGPVQKPINKSSSDSVVEIEIRDAQKEKIELQMQVNFALTPYALSNHVSSIQEPLDMRSYEDLRETMYQTIQILLQFPNLSTGYIATLMSYELRPYQHLFSMELRDAWKACLERAIVELDLMEHYEHNPALQVYWEGLCQLPDKQSYFLDYQLKNKHEEESVKKVFQRVKNPIIYLSKTVNNMNDYTALSRIMNITLSWNPYAQFNLDNVHLSAQALASHDGPRLSQNVKELVFLSEDALQYEKAMFEAHLSQKDQRRAEHLSNEEEISSLTQELRYSPDENQDSINTSDFFEGSKGLSSPLSKESDEDEEPLKLLEDRAQVDIHIIDREQEDFAGQLLKVVMEIQPYQYSNNQAPPTSLDEYRYAELEVQARQMVLTLLECPELSDGYLAQLISHEFAPYSQIFSDQQKSLWHSYLDSMIEAFHLEEPLDDNSALGYLWDFLRELPEQPNFVIHYSLKDQEEKQILQETLHSHKKPMIYLSKTINNMSDYATLSRIMNITLSWNPYVQFNLDNVHLSTTALASDDGDLLAHNIKEMVFLSEDIALYEQAALSMRADCLLQPQSFIPIENDDSEAHQTHDACCNKSTSLKEQYHRAHPGVHLLSEMREQLSQQRDKKGSSDQM